MYGVHNMFNTARIPITVFRPTAYTSSCQNHNCQVTIPSPMKSETLKERSGDVVASGFGRGGLYSRVASK